MKPAIIFGQTGNRCGHDPQNPRLSPPTPIRTGPGGPPRILSLATEKAKEWFFAPQKCPLLQTSPQRQTRSERREACQVVLEFLLSRLDLASLCLGIPTLSGGFIDLDMKTIVAGTGLGQRRCERAIGQLKAAGFMTVKQPRLQTAPGQYLGLRAIRVLTARLFEWLGLGAMLARERFRAAKDLRARAARFGLQLGDFVHRKFKTFIRPVQEKIPLADLGFRRHWNRLYSEAVRNGLDIREAQVQVNTALGCPPAWSPGQGRPERV
ncbi:hypothetical protein FACS189460_0560 [Deltaproteobacteria bacterium]|nr:hypothetical protein FACS189460_0560 [Deltaproteobacteria bacterium]